MFNARHEIIALAALLVVAVVALVVFEIALPRAPSFLKKARSSRLREAAMAAFAKNWRNG
jgi:hypothetical protein